MRKANTRTSKRTGRAAVGVVSLGARRIPVAHLVSRLVSSLAPGPASAAQFSGPEVGSPARPAWKAGRPAGRKLAPAASALWGPRREPSGTLLQQQQQQQAKARPRRICCSAAEDCEQRVRPARIEQKLLGLLITIVKDYPPSCPVRLSLLLLAVGCLASLVPSRRSECRASPSGHSRQPIGRRRRCRRSRAKI